MARMSPSKRAGSRSADEVISGGDGVQPAGAGKPPVASSAVYKSVPKGSTKGGSRDRGHPQGRKRG